MQLWLQAWTLFHFISLLPNLVPAPSPMFINTSCFSTPLFTNTQFVPPPSHHNLILLFIGPYLTLLYFNQLYLFPYLDKLRKFSTWFLFILFFFVRKRQRMFFSPFLNFPRLAEKREQKKKKNNKKYFYKTS